VKVALKQASLAAVVETVLFTLITIVRIVTD